MKYIILVLIVISILFSLLFTVAFIRVKKPYQWMRLKYRMLISWAVSVSLLMLYYYAFY